MRAVQPKRVDAMRLGSILFASPFAFAISIPVFYYQLGSTAPLLTLALLLAVLTGAELVSVRRDVQPPAQIPHLFRLLPILYVPVQLGLIAWAVGVARHGGAEAFAALALSVGVTTGVFGMLAAHELVHSRNRIERLVGLVMLTGMTYRHFRVAHLFGHHRRAATADDAASARQGEGFYAFLMRTVPGQLAEAWSFEQRRVALRKGGLWGNRVVRDAAVTMLVYLAVGWLAGATGAQLLAAESFVGIVVLELFNYIAHYGLQRRRIDGGHEAFSLRHSWNSSSVLANRVIFNMGRHSWHHTRPAAPYETLEWVPAAPELPAGYAGSILLALAPPLWRRIMDPEVQRLHTGSGNATA